MGRVKDYILESGGDRWGRVRFEAIDTRGSGSAAWSIVRVCRAVATIWTSALLRRVALVHVNLGDRGSAVRKGIVVIMSRLVSVPVILHLHAAELTDDYARAGWLKRRLLQIPFRMAQCCVVLGERWRDWLIDEIGVDRDKIEILYNGVPIPAGAATPRQPAIDAAPIILFLGNLMERKGVSDLLHALAGFAGTVPQWRAIFAGGGDLQHYQALAQDLGISAHVEFAGWVDQDKARTLIRGATMLVLPSYDEGLPLVILEALGAGTPVICTPVGAIPEVLQSEETAILVGAGDRPALERALIRLAQDPALRAHLSAQGSSLFRQEFTLGVFLDRLFDIYRRYCGVEIERDPGPGARISDDIKPERISNGR